MTQPNLGSDLARIHRVITRGLEVTIKYTQARAKENSLDTAAWKGLIIYIRTLAAVLHAHHITEDEEAFPYFQKKLLVAPYEALAAEHEQMAAILVEVDTIVDGLTGETRDASATDSLHRAVKRIAEIWGPHIRREEEHLTPEKVREHLSEEEQISLAKRFAKHTQEHSGPAHYATPFILYNLSPEDRAVLSQAMPPVVTQELVPVEWKEMWAPMKPFLLE